MSVDELQQSLILKYETLGWDIKYHRSKGDCNSGLVTFRFGPKPVLEKKI